MNLTSVGYFKEMLDGSPSDPSSKWHQFMTQSVNSFTKRQKIPFQRRPDAAEPNLLCEENKQKFTVRIANNFIFATAKRQYLTDLGLDIAFCFTVCFCILSVLIR